QKLYVYLLRNIRYFYSYMDLYVLTNDAIMRQIGSKLKELRIEKNMKQAELADASGVSVFTISSVENGKTTSLLTIVQLLRALEHLDYLNSFFQEETISPIAYAKLLKNNKKKIRVKTSNTEINKGDSEW
ncbi:MAG: helix-turn-helix transcriptional regulator, partial [Prevotella sp.]|nr:helix-turn-helix transcriptional regulator [Prevotella sp.]